MKIKLNIPVRKKSLFSDVVIEEINLRRPRVCDIVGLDFSNPTKHVDNMVVIVNRMTNIPIETIVQIDMADWSVIGEALGRLIEPLKGRL